MESESEITRLLAEAVADPSKRSVFYEKLLSVRVILIGQVPKFPFYTLQNKSWQIDASGSATELRILRLKRNGKVQIPFFTSFEELRDIPIENEKLTLISSRQFFQLTQSMGEPELGAVLNLASAVGKDFSPEEIRALAHGMIPAQDEVGKKNLGDQTITLSMPAERHVSLENALIHYARTQTGEQTDEVTIQQMWLGLTSFGDPSITPHLLLVLELDGALGPKLLEDLGRISSHLIHPDQVLDIVKLRKDSEFSKAIEQGILESFYRRLDA